MRNVACEGGQEEVKKIEELLALLGTDDVVEAVNNLEGERLGILDCLKADG